MGARALVQERSQTRLGARALRSSLGVLDDAVNATLRASKGEITLIRHDSPNLSRLGVDPVARRERLNRSEIDRRPALSRAPYLMLIWNLGLDEFR